MTLIIIMEYAQEVAFSYSVTESFKFFAIYALSTLEKIDGVRPFNHELIRMS
jgi:hypothetical protein